MCVQAKTKPPIYSLLSMCLCWTVGDLCAVYYGEISLSSDVAIFYSFFPRF